MAGKVPAPWTKIASDALAVSGPPVWMKKPSSPPVGYDAVTTPSVETTLPTIVELVPVPWMSLIGVTAAGAASMVKVKSSVSIAGAASVAVIVTLATTAVVGVPEISPVLPSIERPSGRVLLSSQTIGAVALEAVAVKGVMAAPTTPFLLVMSAIVRAGAVGPAPEVGGSAVEKSAELTSVSPPAALR